MKINITKCIHVTQTERKHILAFLKSGKISAKVNTKIYNVLQGTPVKNGYEYKISIHTPYIRESTNQREFTRQIIELQYLNQ